MVARGHVHNGVVVLDGGIRLPEGQAVTVLVEATATAKPKPHSLRDIRPVSLGAMICPHDSDEGLLGEC
jgi:hypothetical protein